MPLIGSRRMSEESREDFCGGKSDLTKEAQRTNRFNTNYHSQKSASSCLTTTCNRIESSTGVANDYKTEQTDDLPCINIILKPILDTQTDQINKCIHLVELTAVTENNDKHSVSDTNTSHLDQCQSSFKESKDFGMKSVQVQINVEKNLHDSSTQTVQIPTDQKSICISLNKETTSEATVEDLTTSQLPSDPNSACKPNRGVQFRDDNTVADNMSCSSHILRTGVDSMRQDTPASLVECSDSMETLYKLVNTVDESKNSTEFNNKSCIEESGQKTRGKLSDRMKRNIDRLKIGSCVFGTQSLSQTENTSQENRQESMKTTCTDTCKDIASQIKLFKSYSDNSKSSLATQNTSTLASVLSNNSPIPRISINTTDSNEWESPSKNKSSKATISESSLSPSSNNTPCGSDRNFSIREEKNCNATEEDVGKFNSDTGTRGFWDDQTTTLSKLGISGNSDAVGTESTDTVSEANTMKSMPGLPLIDDDESTVKENSHQHGKCCISTAVQTDPISFSQTRNSKFGEKSDFVSPRANTRNFITASELTRPEFIRMLTEIKEHTRSLELQLSAMNEAMKRKQATRNKTSNCTLKNYQAIGEEDLLDYKMQNKKFKTTNENVRCTLKEFMAENSIDTSCCATPDQNSLSEDIQTVNDKTCCRSFTTSKPNESFTLQNSSTDPKTSSQIIVAQDESDISILRHKRKKPGFKTKRCYLRAPLRQSDYRIWKQKLGKRNPSTKSITVSEMLSRSVSPDSFMDRSKIDVSCSPTNCCNPSEDSLQTMFKTGNLSPIDKLEKSDVTAKSATHLTASNPSVDRILVRPAFMSSTLKNTTNPSMRTNDNYIEPSDCRAVSTTTLVPSCDLDTSKYSNDGKKCPVSIRMDPVFGAAKQNEEQKKVSTSPVKLRQSKVKPRLGVKQSSFKSRAQGRPKSIPSNSNICSSANKELFFESSKNCRSRLQARKPSPSQLKESGIVPQMKLVSMNNQSPLHSHIETGNSQPDLDCCRTGIENCELHSVPGDDIPVELLDQNVDKDQFAYTIKTEQNTPTLVNNDNTHDSEEEMSSTDYGLKKCREDSCGKKSKDSQNGKKRNRNSGDKKITKLEEKSNLRNSNSPEVRSWQNNSQSSRYQEHSGYNSKTSTNNSQSISGNQNSVKFKKFDNVLSQSNNKQTDSQQKDSKCTIRVTVSLDKTPADEGVKKV